MLAGAIGARHGTWLSEQKAAMKKRANVLTGLWRAFLRELWKGQGDDSNMLAAKVVCCVCHARV